MDIEINYNGFGDDIIAKEDKALKDCLSWLGRERYVKIAREFKKANSMTMERAEFYMAFAGIHGYPARVFARKYGKILPEELEALPEEVEVL